VSYNFYGAITETGGSTGAADAVDGAALNDIDGLIMIKTSQVARFYTLEESSGATESSPTIISPNSSAGNKRWLMCKIDALGFILRESGTSNTTTLALSSGDMTLTNDIDDKTISLIGKHGGSSKTLFAGDPDGATELYYAGTKEAETISNGLKATHTFNIAGTTTVDAIKDGDAMTSNSATALATQQSIKAYVDNNSGGFASGTKMYFYSDTAPTGWTIDSGVADVLLAVKGGSNAYNTSGGATAGTWTQPGHTHSTPAHTHPGHVHQIYSQQGADADDKIYDSSGSLIDLTSQGTKSSVIDHKCIAVTNNTSTPYPPHMYSQAKTTPSGGSGTSGAQSTSDVWRPSAGIGIIASKD